MTPTVVGLLAGVALGLAAAFGGFEAFLWVLVLGALGAAIGRAAEGRLDLQALLDAVSGRRRLS